MRHIYPYLAYALLGLHDTHHTAIERKTLFGSHYLDKCSNLPIEVLLHRAVGVGGQVIFQSPERGYADILCRHNLCGQEREKYECVYIVDASFHSCSW